ncbi:MAG: hypothetical protein AAF456_17205 [Planctomycetota bacterium]
MTATSKFVFFWKLAVYFVVAVSAVMWLSICFATELTGGDSIVEYVAFTLLVFLCCITGFWAGLGNALWRWLIIPVVSPLYGLLMSSNEIVEFSVFSLGMIFTIMITTLLLRTTKGRLQPVVSTEFREGLQFGIKDILIWTTAIAELITVSRLIFNYVSDDFRINASIIPSILALAACIALTTTINIWGMFGKQISTLKSIGLLFTLVGQVAVSYLLFGRQSGWFIAVCAAVAQLMMLVVLYGLRCQSFRFVSHS